MGGHVVMAPPPASGLCWGGWNGDRVTRGRDATPGDSCHQVGDMGLDGGGGGFGPVSPPPSFLGWFSITSPTWRPQEPSVNERPLMRSGSLRDGNISDSGGALGAGVPPHAAHPPPKPPTALWSISGLDVALFHPMLPWWSSASPCAGIVPERTLHPNPTLDFPSQRRSFASREEEGDFRGRFSALGRRKNPSAQCCP